MKKKIKFYPNEIYFLNGNLVHMKKWHFNSKSIVLLYF